MIFDKQDAFDRMCRGMRDQGRPSYTKEMGCRYRSYDGTKCAIGMLIDDERYHVSMEGRSPTSVLGINTPSLPPEDRQFLEFAQYDHDAAAEATAGAAANEFMQRFLKGMRELAKRYNLNPSALDEPI